MNAQIELTSQTIALSAPVSNALVEEFVDGTMIHGDNFFFMCKDSDVEMREELEDRTVLHLRPDKLSVTIKYLAGLNEQKDDMS